VPRKLQATPADGVTPARPAEPPVRVRWSRVGLPLAVARNSRRLVWMLSVSPGPSGQPAGPGRPWVGEADQLDRLWDAVRDARSDCHHVSMRRQALRALRDTIGPAAYFWGALPHVPLWRFARLD